ncbi:MAG TPA: hypothetical protein VGP73_12185 [Thermoanaerobaculia bacterium]
MTTRLARAFEEASRLPDDVQDEIAERLLEEIAGEERWDETFRKTPDLLEKLADKALADFKAGRT